MVVVMVMVMVMVVVVSGLTVDILSTFCDGFMVQCVKSMLTKFLHWWFLPRDAMHSAVYVVERCLSVRHTPLFCRNGSSNFFITGYSQ